MTTLNEAADTAAKLGTKGEGPPEHVVAMAKGKLKLAKGILETIAQFRVELGEKHTTTYIAPPKRSAEEREQELHSRRERAKARREAKSKHGSWGIEKVGSTYMCRRCHRRAWTTSGLQRLEDLACIPLAERLEK